MVVLASTHNFQRCKGNHCSIRREASKVNCWRSAKWFSRQPRAVAEALFGTRSIWIRDGAPRYPDPKSRAQRSVPHRRF